MPKFIALLFSLLLPAMAFSQMRDTANSEQRKPRKAAVMAELGVNSLASLFGVAGSYYFKPNMAVDAGFGLSVNGLRPGLRYRYLFSSSDFSPFVGAGLKYGLGSRNREIKAEDKNNNNAVYYFKSKPSGFLDLCTGMDFQADNGFFLLGTLGWSQRLSGSGWELTQGTVTDKTRKGLNFIYASGVMLSIAAGWAF